MILKEALTNNSFRSRVQSAVSILEDCRAFQVLLEIGAERGRLPKSSSPMETAALSGAYLSGYNEALKDLHGLAVVTEEQTRIQPNFGVVAALHKKGDLTDDEFEQFKSRNAVAK